MTQEQDRMNEQEIHYQMVVGGCIKNKLQEYEYFLKKIIAICDLAKINSLAEKSLNAGTDENINFTFNAFINTFQSLRDALGTAIGQEIPWSQFSEVRHWKFIKECRNATTHDGMEIINSAVSGKYYISHDIERIEGGRNRRRLITIEAPEEDVLSLCLQFSIDLMQEIENITNEYGASIPVQSYKNKTEEFKKYIDTPLVPEDVKAFFQHNSGVIEQLLEVHKFNPAEDIRKQISSIRNLCNIYENALVR
jgi:hypothetical protein